MPGPIPILVLGSGQRCGTTLIQRLLSSHPDILVWGEHGGHLREILRASDTLRRWDEGLSAPAREEFAQRAHHGWLANLLPEPAAVSEAARSYLRTLFAAPAAALGRPRWGFKEVRFGLEEAQAIRELFPKTRVIHVTRDPRDVLRSLDWWERGGPSWSRDYTAATVASWTSINNSFVDDGRGLAWVQSWRYEDVLADHDRFIDALAALVEVSPGDLDRSVLQRRVYSYQEPAGRTRRKRHLRTFHELPPDLRSLLDDDALRRTASAYGYELTG